MNGSLKSGLHNTEGEDVWASVRGIGYASKDAVLFNSHKSIRNGIVPSGFGMSTMGLYHSLCVGLITPSSNMFSTSLFMVSHAIEARFRSGFTLPDLQGSQWYGKSGWCARGDWKALLRGREEGEETWGRTRKGRSSTFSISILWALPMINKHHADHGPFEQLAMNPRDCGISQGGQLHRY